MNRGFFKNEIALTTSNEDSGVEFEKKFTSSITIRASSHFR
jgi:hypothetical protein